MGFYYKQTQFTWRTLKKTKQFANFENGHLTQLQKQSIITLIPKPGKNEKQLGNWRPLSLLNIDYKIATKVISKRLQKYFSLSLALISQDS